MRLLSSLSVLCIVLSGLAAAAQEPKPKPTSGQTPAGAVRTVDIIGTDDMKYSVNTITAKRGEQLRVRVISKGTLPKIAMAHNFVLLKKGTDELTFINAGAQHRGTDFIAPETKGSVLAATKFAGPGETVEVTFKVPAVAGRYPYLCTFSGHYQAGMKGVLIVK